MFQSKQSFDDKTVPYVLIKLCDYLRLERERRAMEINAMTHL